MRRVYESLLLWTSNKYYIPSCVCVCVHLRTCVHVPGHVGMRMRVRAYNLAYPACNAYASFCDVICNPTVDTIFFDIIS